MKKKSVKLITNRVKTSHVRRNTWSEINPVGQNLGTKPVSKVEKQNGKKRKCQQSHDNFEDCRNRHPHVNHRQNKEILKWWKERTFFKSMRDETHKTNQPRTNKNMKKKYGLVPLMQPLHQAREADNQN